MRDNDTVSEINLGMPEVAASPFPRKQTRRIMVGDVPVGGGARVSVQSMTTTKTHDIGATLQQIAELTAAGCDIVRVACPTDKDADALPIIAKQSRIPVIADIHFKPKYVFQAIEAGPAFQGTIKSVSAFSVLLAEGIGDTIRVSLSAPPVEEIKVGTKMLEFMGLREKTLEIVSCPSCGRAQVDVWTLAEDVTEGLKDLTVPLRVAVMGCVVNGPGEAREADLGVASGNGKGQIFIRGEVVETVPEDQIVETLIRRANALAEELGLEPGSGSVEVAPITAPDVKLPGIDF